MLVSQDTKPELLGEIEQLKQEKRYLESKLLTITTSHKYQLGVVLKSIVRSPRRMLLSPLILGKFTIKVLWRNFDKKILFKFYKLKIRFIKPQKVAFIINSGLVGGAERIYAMHLKWAAEKYGVDAYFREMGGPIVDEVSSIADRVFIKWPTDNMLADYKYLYICQYIPDLERIKQINPDIKISFILHDHLSGWIEIFQQTKKWQYLDRIYCISKLIKNELAQAIPDMPVSKVEVMHNSYFFGNTDQDYVPTDRNSQEFVFGYNGRISPEKNTLGLVKMFKEFHKQNPAAKLIITGDIPVKASPTLQHYKQLFLEEIAGCDFIEYWGFLSDSRKLFREIDGLVLSSFVEGVSVSALEAMSFGVPVISTNVGGMGEIIQNGENGTLVDIREYKFNPFQQGDNFQSLHPDDTAKFIRALENFVKMKWNHHLIATETISHYSPDVIKQKFQKSLAELIN